ncbi:MAG: hypothetical protein JWQ50_3497 [Caballeronia mineralivorans]|nr:hypothetical protein [Caballeronia mineralivorans]
MEPILGILRWMSSVFLCGATLYDRLLNKGLRVDFGVVELHFEISCTGLGRRTQTLATYRSRFQKSGISFRMRAFIVTVSCCRCRLATGLRCKNITFFASGCRLNCPMSNWTKRQSPRIPNGRAVHTADYIARVARRCAQCARAAGDGRSVVSGNGGNTPRPARFCCIQCRRRERFACCDSDGRCFRPRYRRHRRYSSPDDSTCRRCIRRQTQRNGAGHALFGEIHLKRFETQ